MELRSSEQLGAFHIFRSIANGKTLARTLLNIALSGHRLSGRVLDVAGGCQPSYLRYLQIAPGTERLVAEVDDRKAPDRCFDATKTWPEKDAVFDQVLLINCIYIFPDPTFVLREAFRVLRPGGTLLINFPFTQAYIPEPNDYFRFTIEGSAKLLNDSGFMADSPVFIGGRFTSAVEYFRPVLSKFRLYAPTALLVSRFEDWATRHGYASFINQAPIYTLWKAEKRREL